MKSFFASGVTLLLFASAVCGADRVPAGVSPFAAWAYRVPIRVATPITKPLTEFAVPPEVLGKLAADENEVRIGAAADRIVDSVLRGGNRQLAPALLTANIAARGVVPGQESFAVVDLTTPLDVSDLAVDTAGADFRRRAWIDASDDAKTWTKRLDDGLLLRLGADPGVMALDASYDRNLITIPMTTARYLRIHVCRAAEDKEDVEIRDVRVWRQRVKDDASVDVPFSITRATVTDEGAEFDLDVEYTGLHLAALRFEVEPGDFAADVEVQGRTGRARKIRGIGDFGVEVEQTVEETWRPVNNKAVIYRMSLGAPYGTVELPTVDLAATECRFLRVIVQRRGARLPKFRIAGLTRYPLYVGFQPEAGLTYFLYLGNVNATEVPFDLLSKETALRAQGVQKAELGALEPNPVFGQQPPPPSWLEQHRALLGSVAFLVALVLAVIIGRKVWKATAQLKDEV